jgi:glucan biosynthesis protein C
MQNMNSPTAKELENTSTSTRLDYLDATRAFALVLGVIFHASLSFIPIYIGWAVQDVSTSPFITAFMTVSHTFRMETFFLLAGFFSHLALHRQDVGTFIRSRFFRLVVPFVLGWFVLHPLLISSWFMGSESLRGAVNIWADLRNGFKTLDTLPRGLFTGSHLWFLYYLCLITGLMLITRRLGQLSGRWYPAAVRSADAAVRALLHSPFSLPILAVPTAAALWCLPSWSMVTPDQTLIPNLPVLGIYGTFFALGWLLHRQIELLPRFTRFTWATSIQAFLGVTGIILLGHIERDPVNPHYLDAHITYVLSYALTMWSLVVITIATFHKLCARPNPIVRYVADSSYWMYLIHLPVVIWLQIAVAAIPLHWSVKLAAISALTIIFSLLTYDLFVRATFLGWLLNGQRRPRQIFAANSQRR